MRNVTKCQQILNLLPETFIKSSNLYTMETLRRYLFSMSQEQMRHNRRTKTQNTEESARVLRRLIVFSSSSHMIVIYALKGGTLRSVKMRAFFKNTFKYFLRFLLLFTLNARHFLYSATFFMPLKNYI